MNSQTDLKLPQSDFSSFNIPLLDDEFDPEEKDIFDHSELTSLYVAGRKPMSLYFNRFDKIYPT